MDHTNHKLYKPLQKPIMIRKFFILVSSISIAIYILGLPIQTAKASSYTEKEQTPVYSYHVVNSYPHDPKAFTQGLIYYRGELYESTGEYDDQRSSLRRIELETGEIVEPPSPIQIDEFAEGITLWKNRIIQLTLNDRIGFVYDRDTFEQIDDFSYKTKGWGLTHNGQHLIMSDGTEKLYFLDPDSFQVIDSIEVRDLNQPIKDLNELEYIDGEIFANVLSIDHIARINPTTGHVISWIDLTGLRGSVGTPKEWENVNNNEIAVLNGIAYDEKGKRIFVTGKLWPYLFEIELVPDQSKDSSGN